MRQCKYPVDDVNVIVTGVLIEIRSCQVRLNLLESLVLLLSKRKRILDLIVGARLSHTGLIRTKHDYSGSKFRMDS